MYYVNTLIRIVRQFLLTENKFQMNPLLYIIFSLHCQLAKKLKNVGFGVDSAPKYE